MNPELTRLIEQYLSGELSESDKALAPVEVYPHVSPGSPPWKPTVTCVKAVVPKQSMQLAASTRFINAVMEWFEKWRMPGKELITESL